MIQSATLGKLRAWRRRLFMAYFCFIALFASSLAMAASGIIHQTVLAGFGFCALAALPLLIINLVVHRIIQALHPGAGSAGIKQLLVSIVFFTAVEAVLILPMINLVISGRLLRKHAAAPLDEWTEPPP